MHKHITLLLILITSIFFFSCENKSISNTDIKIFSYNDIYSKTNPEKVYDQYKSFTSVMNNCKFGFIRGTLWLAIEVPKNQNKLYLDIGPEPIDRADLYALDYNNDFQLIDSCGRNTLLSERKAKFWRQGLSIPFLANGTTILLKIKNFDSTALSIRLYNEDEYIQETINMTIFHSISMSFFVLGILCMLICIQIFKNKKFLYLFCMTLSFFLYLIMINGFGITYFFNSLIKTSYLNRLSYVFSSLGEWFIILLFTEDANNKFLHSFTKIVRILFSIISLFFIIFFTFAYSINLVYQMSLIVLLLGSLIIIFLSIYRYKISNNINELMLLVAWIPNILYTLFRQTYHLIRNTHSIAFIDNLLNNDYYFSYEICFLFQIIIYIYVTFLMIYKTKEKPHTKKEQIEVITSTVKPDKLSLYKEFSLTKREIEITELLQQDNMTTSQIAENLNISKETVASHIKHILSKTKTNSRLDLLRLLMK